VGCKNVPKMERKKAFQLYRKVDEHMEEDLNIENHWKVMVTYALRKYQSVKEAAPHLGVTSRTVFRLINRWDIDWKCPDLEPMEKNIE